MLRRPLDAGYLVLIALRRNGPATTYEIQAWVRTQTGGEWDVSNGAVYPAVRRLIGGGFVTSSAIEDDRAGPPTHRLMLTPTGDAAAVELGNLVGRFGIHLPLWQGPRE